MPKSFSTCSVGIRGSLQAPPEEGLTACVRLLPATVCSDCGSGCVTASVRALPAGSSAACMRLHAQGPKLPVAPHAWKCLKPQACLLCLQGYYCPTTTAILTCPQGSFCKWWSKEPKSCPWLATCEAGAKSADLSLAGFFSMAAILLALWLTYMACDAYIRSAPAWASLIGKPDATTRVQVQGGRRGRHGWG